MHSITRWNWTHLPLVVLTHVNQEAIGFGSLVVKQLVFFLANVAVVIGMQFC